MSTKNTQEILTESIESWMKMNNQSKDDEDLNDPYPWLPETDIRKTMTDNEILDKIHESW